MFKGTINAGTYTSGYLPLTQDKNTNNVFALGADNQIAVNKSGIVDVKANIVITATNTGVMTAQLYGNDAAISGAMCKATEISGGTYTLTINDAVLITNTTDNAVAKIGIQLSNGATLVGGDVICEYRP